MTDRTWYQPTAEEQLRISRAGVTAAWQALQTLLDDELSWPDQIAVCVKAFDATQTAAWRESKSVLSEHPGFSRIHHNENPTDLVCSAMSGICLENPNEIHPDSLGGRALSALLHAVQLLNAMSAIEQTFDYEGVGGDHLAEEALILLNDRRNTQ